LKPETLNFEPETLNLLTRFSEKTVLVLGDFFLDEYLLLDRTLSETSLETGLEAYQVIERRVSPGAAGTVAANLRALGAKVIAMGVIGDDGHGFELRRALSAQDINITDLLIAPARVTPTYTKPMMREPDGTIHELNRLDTKNRTPLPYNIPPKLVARLWHWATMVDAIVVGDQVTEPVGGVVNGTLRAALEELGRTERLIMVDSRARGNLFRNVILKLNAAEATRAAGQSTPDAAARTLSAQTGKPVFVTTGEKGIWVATRRETVAVAGVSVPPPIDPVGAGDATIAALALALSSGASPTEAAALANLAAAVTVRKIGTTGTATPAEILEMAAFAHPAA